MNGYNILGKAGLVAPGRSLVTCYVTCRERPDFQPVQLAHARFSFVTVPAELDVVVAPKLKPEAAVLLLPAPGPKTNGVTAALDVVAGLLSGENSKD